MVARPVQTVAANVLFERCVALSRLSAKDVRLHLNIAER